MDAAWNWCADFIQSGINWLADVLPQSPFQWVLSFPNVSYWVGILNYFIPITAMLALLQAWLVAVGLYMVASVLLRWLKAIE